MSEQAVRVNAFAEIGSGPGVVEELDLQFNASVNVVATQPKIAWLFPRPFDDAKTWKVYSI